MTILGHEIVKKMRDALSLLLEETDRLMKANGRQAAAESPLANELKAFAPPELIHNACYFGVTFIDFGAEHVSVLVKILVEPIEVIAFWTCVRSMLESCAMAAWLLDSEIDARTRAGRVFMLRYEEMECQAKLLRALKDDPQSLAKLTARMDEVERFVVSLGYPKSLNSKKKRDGFVGKMPSTTDMIELTLHDAKSYRMLSAVAHGHSWAIRGLGWAEFGSQLMVDGVPMKQLEKTVNPDAIALMGLSAAKALARPLWNLFRLYGWNSEDLTNLLENVFDRIGTNDNQRFWRA